MTVQSLQGNSYLLSMRWKLLLILASVSMLFGAISAYYFQHELQMQFESKRREVRLNNTHQMIGLMALNVERIRQLTIALPSFVDMQDVSLPYNTSKVYRRFEKFWSNFQLDMGVEEATLYSINGDMTATWGGGQQENTIMHSQARQDKWNKAFKSESATSLIDCSQTCLIYAYAPVLKEKKVAGVFSIAASLADAVLNFHEISHADVLVIFTDTIAVSSEKTIWGKSIAAASHPQNIVPLVQRASLRYTLSDISTQPIRYVESNQTYEISMVKLEPNFAAEGMNVLVVDNVTSELNLVKKNIGRMMAIIGIGVLLLLLLLYLLLSLPLKRLRNIAQSIPLLGQGAFEQLRQEIKLKDKVTFDELDVLDQSAVKLSYKLESLEHEVAEQNLSLRKLVTEVTREKEFASSLLSQAEAIIATTNAAGEIDTLNRFGSILTGMSAGDLIYRDMPETEFIALKQALVLVAQGTRDNHQHESVLLGSDKKQHTISWVHTRLNNNVLLSVGMDVTELKNSQQVIHHLAYYDVLTDLPNRSLLLDRLKHAMNRSARNGKDGGLLLINLDAFKSINDTLSHHAGDVLLQEVAKSIGSCISEEDTISRIGGDEFIVLLEELSETSIEAAAQAKAIASKIQLSLNLPFQLEGHAHNITASIGISLFKNHDAGVDEVMKQVGIALHQSKSQGVNGICFYDPKMQQILTDRFSLEQELRIAINANQLALYYQIQVDDSGHPLGAEALVRWLHPERGVITPFHFIPLAEETGLILVIGQWVLEAACAQLNLWQHSEHTKHLTIAVNVSVHQFRLPDFVSTVISAINTHSINPMLLKLELTESMLVDSIDDTIIKMEELKKLGIRFSLDDFGTGYSSLQYLKRLPLYQLKIDQSFVRDIADDVSDQAIVRTIIAMAQTLNLNVIAEGVETEEQCQLLFISGCNTYQGYLFSRPVPIDEFEALLRAN